MVTSKFSTYQNKRQINQIMLSSLSHVSFRDTSYYIPNYICKMCNLLLALFTFSTSGKLLTSEALKQYCDPF
jgi:hypothetical protein